MIPCGSNNDVRQPPLAQVLSRITSLRALAVEAEAATQLLGPLLDVLVAKDEGVVPLLLKFNYCPASDQHGGGYFHKIVDLQGLASTLSKYRYQRLCELGKGSYAVVYKARNRETGELIALKKLRNSLLDSGFTAAAVREISMLKELRHENIVELKDIISSLNGSHIYLVLECMECDLREYLDTVTNASSIPSIKMILYQILLAIKHAHLNLVMHRDLKPQNILVNKASGHCKVTDFGLARHYLPPFKAYSDKVVTLYYRAPELLLGSPHYSTAVDMWSIGCIMAELLNFQPLFRADSEIGLLYTMFETLGTPSEVHWQEINQAQHFNADFPKWEGKPFETIVPRLANDPQGIDLLAALLRYNPRQRPTAHQALGHPWFRDVQHLQPQQQQQQGLAGQHPQQHGLAGQHPQQHGLAGQQAMDQ